MQDQTVLLTIYSVDRRQGSSLLPLLALLGRGNVIAAARAVCCLPSAVMECGDGQGIAALCMADSSQNIHQGNQAHDHNSSLPCAVRT